MKPKISRGHNPTPLLRKGGAHKLKTKDVAPNYDYDTDELDVECKLDVFLYPSKETWDNAKLHSLFFERNGFKDWRIPTHSEIVYLLKMDAFLFFDEAVAYYWTSEECLFSNSKALLFCLASGFCFPYSKDTPERFILVRDNNE